MPVRIRYLGHNLEVPEGQFVIGRSSTCQLSIDDPMISRQHAVLVVQGELAVVQDLGSRNGVLVNGKRVVGEQQLAEGDEVTIGGQSLRIHGLRSSRQMAAVATRRLDMHDTMIGADIEDTHTAHGASAALTTDPDRRVHELSLVGAVAEKALALGRAEDAAKLLERPLREMLARTRRHAAGDAGAASVDEAAARRAAGLCMKLASSLGQGSWIELVFELYTARRDLMPQTTVDELYELLRRVRVDGRCIVAYRQVLEGLAERRGPTAKFLASRVEGLERLAGLK